MELWITQYTHVFRLELPSKKSIGVKAKPLKIVRDVLGPILNQYGWGLADVTVTVAPDGGEVIMTDTVSSIDNCRLTVTQIPVAPAGAAAAASGAAALHHSFRPVDVGSSGSGHHHHLLPDRSSGVGLSVSDAKQKETYHLPYLNQSIV